MTTDVLEPTRRWVSEFVVGLDLCPFARQPLRDGLVSFVACESDEFEAQLEAFVVQAERLITTSPDELSNILLAFANAPSLQDFDDYLDLAAAAEAVLEDLEVDHLIQLASFHPDYLFDGAREDDPANATNRSPLPMLHLLRVDEVEEAIARHPDIDAIPERNCRLLRERAGWS